MLNEEDRRPILIKNMYYQKGFGARKLMKQYAAVTWKKIVG